MATKLCDEFFEEYVTLLRLRIDQYHERNGGEADFINQLIACPRQNSNSYFRECIGARYALDRLEEAIQDNYFEAYILRCFLDEQMRICYVVSFWMPGPSDDLGEFIEIHIVVDSFGHLVECLDGDDILNNISDDVWREYIARVHGELSFGTMLGMPLPLDA